MFRGNRAVIFDVDGVLVDSFQAHLQSWRDVANRYGLPMSLQDFSKTFGRTSREIIRELWNIDDEHEITGIDADKEARYREIVMAHFPAMDGAVELIDALAASGVRLAVGSSGPKENLDLALGRLNRKSAFSAAISGSDVLQGKPHPAVFINDRNSLACRRHNAS